MEAAAAASSRPLDCAAGDGSVTDRLLVDSGSQTEAAAKQTGGWTERRRQRCSVVSLASLGAVSLLLLAALLILLLGSHTWLHSHESDKLADSDGDCMAASVGMRTGTWTYEDRFGPQIRSWTVRPPAALTRQSASCSSCLAWCARRGVSRMAGASPRLFATSTFANRYGQWASARTSSRATLAVTQPIGSSCATQSTAARPTLRQ